MLQKKIQAFLSIADTQSVSKTAEVLFTSQSTISAQLRSLESELGVQLFDRMHSGMRLNDHGKLFLQYARKIDALYNEARIQLQKSVQRDGTLKVITNLYLSTYIIPYVEAIINNKYPLLKVEIQTKPSKEIVENPEKYSFDIAILTLPAIIPYRGLFIEWLFDDHMIPVCSPKSRLANLEKVEPHDLLNEELIVLDSTYYKQMVFTQMAVNGLSINQVKEFDNFETIKKAVENDLGISFLPYFSVERDLIIGSLKKIPMGKIYFYRPGCYAYKIQPLPQIPQVFVNALRSYIFQYNYVY